MSWDPSPNPNQTPNFNLQEFHSRYLTHTINYLSPSPHPLLPSPQIPSPPSSHGLPPMSPAPEGFSLRLIDAKHTFGQVNHPPEGNVIDLISDLNIDNKPIEETVQSHTKKIAELQTNGQRYCKEIAELKSLLALSSEVVKIKANVQSKMLQF
ncbi:hypothetical protein PCANC_22212 [Puccinia coronata f. sp. avenae]|uniref:Uncharacterized protein n=1 Tax=Puccinia coronata f. sp. avenae TaxID=200324 RepID=A0A2N5SCN6_9BASI|nr:hypothetical protein PCANC_22212 [Puccinia coronata f. sp. avenae]